jgi:hypothetical protein
VDLPIGDTLAGLTNATFETWCTWDHRLSQTWSRVFDFGSDTTFNMFLTLRCPTQTPRFSITVNGGGGEEQLTMFMPASLQSPMGFYPNTAENGMPVETHITITFDADNKILTGYLNGMPVTTVIGWPYTPSTLATAPNSPGSPTQNYLGKSQYADPYFSGSINEFRIYDRALSAAEVAANDAAGPDGTPP